MENNKIGQHISKQFNQEMEGIRNKVLMMGGLVEQQTDMAVKAFMNVDIEMAEKVLQQEILVNNLELQIDEECTQILAKRQPAAFDLRMLLSIIKTITDLERIGDEAARIAKITQDFNTLESSSDNKYYEVQHLVEIVKDMLNNSLNAFARVNIDGIIEITTQDEKVDREYNSIIRQLITRMMENPRNISHSIDILWIARALERIGDHAFNVCEHVIYIVKGEDVRHLSHTKMEEKINAITQ